MQQANYNRVAQILHWLSALLIIGLAVAGLVMVRLDDGVALKTTMYRVHTMVGSVVLLLTIGRIVWIFVGGRPSPLPMPARNRLGFSGVHMALYGIILLMTFSGIAMLLASGVSIPAPDLTPADIQDVAPRQGHIFFSRLLILLFLAHVAGVIFYQLNKGDTMGRMGISWFSGRYKQ